MPDINISCHRNPKIPLSRPRKFIHSWHTRQIKPVMRWMTMVSPVVGKTGLKVSAGVAILLTGQEQALNCRNKNRVIVSISCIICSFWQFLQFVSFAMLGHHLLVVADSYQSTAQTVISPVSHVNNYRRESLYISVKSVFAVRID